MTNIDGKMVPTLIPPDPFIKSNSDNFIHMKSETKRVRALAKPFMENHKIRRMLQKRESEIQDIDRNWMKLLPVYNQTSNKIDQLFDFYNVREKFQECIPIYVNNRSDLEKEVQGVKNLGQLFCSNGEAISDKIKLNLSEKISKAMTLVYDTGKSMNNLASWSMIQKPNSKGPTWYRLGKSQRKPFNMYVSVREAGEIFEMVEDLAASAQVLADLHVSVNMDQITKMVEVMVPKLETDSNKAPIFFIGLDSYLTGDMTDNDSSGSPNKEEVDMIQSLITGGLEGTDVEQMRLKIKSLFKKNKLDETNYFDTSSKLDKVFLFGSSIKSDNLLQTEYA